MGTTENKMLYSRIWKPRTDFLLNNLSRMGRTANKKQHLCMLSYIYWIWTLRFNFHFSFRYGFHVKKKCSIYQHHLKHTIYKDLDRFRKKQHLWRTWICKGICLTFERHTDHRRLETALCSQLDLEVLSIVIE